MKVKVRPTKNGNQETAQKYEKLLNKMIENDPQLQEELRPLQEELRRLNNEEIDAIKESFRLFFDGKSLN